LFGHSGRLNVLSTGALGASTFFVGHKLTDLEFLDAAPFDGTVMEEQVSTFSGDEAKSLVSDQLLDRPFRHDATPSERPKTRPPTLPLEPLLVKEDRSQTESEKITTFAENTSRESLLHNRGVT
jgi:hypothetical protein